MPSPEYWSWVCHKCGYDDNRNTNRNCLRCNATIRCEVAGGHTYSGLKMDRFLNTVEQIAFCDNGCGRDLNGKLDLSKRREDY